MDDLPRSGGTTDNAPPVPAKSQRSSGRGKSNTSAERPQKLQRKDLGKTKPYKITAAGEVSLARPGCVIIALDPAQQNVFFGRGFSLSSQMSARKTKPPTS